MNKVLKILWKVEYLLELLNDWGAGGYDTAEYSKLQKTVLKIANLPEFSNQTAQTALYCAASRLNAAAALTNLKIALPWNKNTFNNVKHSLEGAIIHLNRITVD